MIIYMETHHDHAQQRKEKKRGEMYHVGRKKQGRRGEREEEEEEKGRGKRRWG